MKAGWTVDFKGVLLKSDVSRSSIPVIRLPIQQRNIKQRRECKVLLKSELFKKVDKVRIATMANISLLCLILGAAVICIIFNSFSSIYVYVYER